MSEKLDELCRSYCKDRGNKSLYTKLAAETYKEFEMRIKGSGSKDKDMEDAGFDAISKSLIKLKYSDIDPPCFTAYIQKAINNSRIDVCRAQKKEMERTQFSFDESVGNDDNGATYRDITKDENPHTDVANEIQNAGQIAEWLNFLNNAILTEIVKYRGSPRVCYYGYLYTEFLSSLIYAERDPGVYIRLNYIVMKVFDREFADMYLDGPKESVRGINDCRIRKLKEVMECDNDTLAVNMRSNDVGYTVRSEVYIEFVDRLFSKKMTASALSGHRSKFEDLIQKAIPCNVSMVKDG